MYVRTVYTFLVTFKAVRNSQVDDIYLAYKTSFDNMAAPPLPQDHGYKHLLHYEYN